MNEELKSRLTGYLDYLETAVKKGGDFVGEQAPEVAREFVLMNRIEASVFMGCGVALCLIALFLFVLGVFAYRRGRMETGESAGMIGVAFATAGVLVVAFNIHSFAMAWFAPRVLILEEIAKMVK